MAEASASDEPNEFETANRWDKAWRLYRFANERGHTLETVAAWTDADWADALAAVQHQTTRQMNHPSELTKGVVIGLMAGAEARARG